MKISWNGPGLIATLVLFLCKCQCEAMAVQCCEGIGTEPGVNPLPPSNCANTAVFTLKEGKTGYSQCAEGEGCTQFSCSQKNCTESIAWNCKRLVYSTCGNVPASWEEENCITSNRQTPSSSNKRLGMPFCLCMSLLLLLASSHQSATSS